jgi:hypothetical protein
MKIELEQGLFPGYYLLHKVILEELKTGRLIF